PQQVDGPKLRIRAESFSDHFSQARLFFRSQTKSEQSHIASAFTFELSKVEMEHVRKRVLSLLRNVDEALAAQVADGLAMDLPDRATPAREPVDLDLSDALSIQKNWTSTLKGRTVGILFDEGSDSAELERLIKAVEDAGGTAFTVAPKVGGLSLEGGKMKADGQLAGSPSVLFDAVALVLTAEAAKKLSRNGAAVAFVVDAFSHLKAIGLNDGAKTLLDRAGVEAGPGVTGLDGLVEAATQRYWEREASME
ncbi:hypothetical protein CG51_17475, partial [Haematobacter missouriensis]